MSKKLIEWSKLNTNRSQLLATTLQLLIKIVKLYWFSLVTGLTPFLAKPKNLQSLVSLGHLVGAEHFAKFGDISIIFFLGAM